MSSNIQVQRICQYCNIEFTAKTTVTKYCSHKCANASGKARKRTEKIKASNLEVKKVKSLPIEELKAKEFLSVTQVSRLIGCSRQNVYKLINSGKLKATNLLEKKTIVKRSDINELFELIQLNKTTNKTPQIHYCIEECYNISEVLKKYKVSEKGLHSIIKRNDIPKMKEGRFSYVPKVLIDELLS